MKGPFGCRSASKPCRCSRTNFARRSTRSVEDLCRALLQASVVYPGPAGRHRQRAGSRLARTPRQIVVHRPPAQRRDRDLQPVLPAGRPPSAARRPYLNLALKTGERREAGGIRASVLRRPRRTRRTTLIVEERDHVVSVNLDSRRSPFDFLTTAALVHLESKLTRSATEGELI